MAVVILTGCSSGFGLEGALAFARNGDTVYATMRDPARATALRQAADAENLAVRVKPLDVTGPHSFAPFVAEVLEEAGGIDVLVNNAGIVRPGACEDLPEPLLREVMETNFFGPILLTRAVLPHMRARGSGYLIVISSLSGLAGLPGDAIYAASKFALEGAFEALRHEVDRWGIKVALVEAGLFATRIFDASLRDSDLPDYYPENSPYRALVEAQLRGLRERIAQAADPRVVGELLATIANSDGTRLRWPAGEVAAQITERLRGLHDAQRDAFLRQAAGTEWWSEGKEKP